MSKRVKRLYPEDRKTMFGVTTMCLISEVGGALLASILMMYLTDYSGLYVGIPGKAAAAITTMLFIGRLWDGINDPIAGILLDRSPRTRWGRYKPYFVVGTVIVIISVVSIFNIPKGWDDSLKLALFYICYLAFDTGTTISGTKPVIYTLSKETRVRNKMFAKPRYWVALASMSISFITPISIALSGDALNPAYGKTILLFILPVGLLSLLGILLVREGNVTEHEEKLQWSDFISLVRTNKVWLIGTVIGLFNGLAYPLVSSTATYYLKYTFGAENIGFFGMIWGLCMVLSIFLGTIFGNILMKKLSADKALGVTMLVAAAAFGVLFVLNLGGPIRNPVLLYALCVLGLIGIHSSYVPVQLISLDAADYNRLTLGKGMIGVLNSIGGLISKGQTAIATAIAGMVLVAVNYDASSFQDLANVPASFYSSMGGVFFGATVVVCLISAVLAFKFYPLKGENRTKFLGQIAELDAKEHAE